MNALSLPKLASLGLVLLAAAASAGAAPDSADPTTASGSQQVYQSVRCDGKARVKKEAGGWLLQCEGHWYLTLLTTDPFPAVRLDQGMSVDAAKAALNGSEIAHKEEAGSLRVGELELRFVDGALASYARAGKARLLAPAKTIDLESK